MFLLWNGGKKFPALFPRKADRPHCFGADRHPATGIRIVGLEKKLTSDSSAFPSLPGSFSQGKQLTGRRIWMNKYPGADGGLTCGNLFSVGLQISKVDNCSRAINTFILEYNSRDWSTTGARETCSTFSCSIKQMLFPVGER
ncbi:UNVERIFIED_CONTAM: hypothetical protein PYX00_009261 [Menopon gallinae]|uniref:Uncharacterized protein n=1 Tax=Menopon gallinae TaxID=328185 RepID=A0AAW2HAJ6_9NEOP